MAQVTPQEAQAVIAAGGTASPVTGAGLTPAQSGMWNVTGYGGGGGGGGATPPAPSNLAGADAGAGSPWDFDFGDIGGIGGADAGAGSPWDYDFGGPEFSVGGTGESGVGGWGQVESPWVKPWGSTPQAWPNANYSRSGGGGENQTGKGGGGGALPGGISPAQQQQQAGLKQEKFQQGLQNFMTMMKALGINLGGGGTAFQPVVPPDYMALIRAAIDAAAKKQNLALSEEAAATGGAGGSVLAGFQGQVAQAQQGAYGQAAAGAAQQQFTGQLQAQALQAQQQIAQFNQLMKFIQAMGPLLGG